MPRRKGGSGVTVGFYGTGEMDIEAAMNLIDENLADYRDEPLRFLFIITSDEFSDTLGELVQLAINSDIPYEAITSPNDKARRTFNDAFSAASKTHSVEDPIELLRSTLVESAGGRLMMLWDKDREDEMQEVVSVFLEDSVPAFDLTDAMTPIGFPPKEEAEEAAEAEPVEGEPVYARSDLQKMSREELREIAGRLGIPARRASAQMVEDILDTQGEPGEGEPEAAEETEETERVSVTMVPVPSAPPEEMWERLDKAFDRFTSVLLSGLEDVIARIGAASPPSTPPPAEPPRRLSRRSG